MWLHKLIGFTVIYLLWARSLGLSLTHVYSLCGSLGPGTINEIKPGFIYFTSYLIIICDCSSNSAKVWARVLSLFIIHNYWKLGDTYCSCIGSSIFFISFIFGLEYIWSRIGKVWMPTGILLFQFIACYLLLWLKLSIRSCGK